MASTSNGSLPSWPKCLLTRAEKLPLTWQMLISVGVPYRIVLAFHLTSHDIWPAGFALSTFIALLYITTSSPLSEIYVAEVYTVLSLCLGGSRTSSSIDRRVIGLLIEEVLFLALKFYAIWFIFIGVDKMAHPPCSRLASSPRWTFTTGTGLISSSNIQCPASYRGCCFLVIFFSAMADDDGISGLWKVAEQRFFDFTSITLLLYESSIREAGDEDIFENRTLPFMVLLPPPPPPS